MHGGPYKVKPCKGSVPSIWSPHEVRRTEGTRPTVELQSKVGPCWAVEQADQTEMLNGKQFTQTLHGARKLIRVDYGPAVAGHR